MYDIGLQTYTVLRADCQIHEELQYLPHRRRTTVWQPLLSRNTLHPGFESLSHTYCHCRPFTYSPLYKTTNEPADYRNSVPKQTFSFYLVKLFRFYNVSLTVSILISLTRRHQIIYSGTRFVVLQQTQYIDVRVLKRSWLRAQLSVIDIVRRPLLPATNRDRE